MKRIARFIRAPFQVLVTEKDAGTPVTTFRNRYVERRVTTPTTRSNKTECQLPRRDMDVQRLLTELAQILVPAGITPKRFGELAKYAFVQAASVISRFHNGKINHSRVAVLTGLSRVEVKRLLRDKRSRRTPLPVQQTRAERVLHGWISNRRFLDRKGNPRHLPITGKGISFESLVKEFGGDVPHRAVLEELLRMRAVIKVNKLLKLTRRRSPSTNQLSVTLSLLLPMLADGIRVAASKASIPIYRITLSARNPLDLALLRDRASEGVISLLDGLKDSLPYSVTNTRSSKKTKNRLTITALIASESPTISNDKR